MTEAAKSRRAHAIASYRRGTEHDSGPDTRHSAVERAFAHLHWFHRLRSHRENHDSTHEAFLASRIHTHLPAAAELIPVGILATPRPGAAVHRPRATREEGRQRRCGRR